MKLPAEFTFRMRRILGEEYSAFERSYEEPRRYGLRINTLKLTPEEFEAITPFPLSSIPFLSGGYTYPEGETPGRHPFYHAGLYYLQEPSAMVPASVLAAKPGEKVLDLCAAPGGKATALGAALNRQGLLVANDLSTSRARALLKNIELFGIPNSFITTADPLSLCGQFGDFFDRILVDAPCSGEGMFRKDADAVRAWHPEKPTECALVQRQILSQAVRMLRPGGCMLYSTCTFEPEEDEEIVSWLLTEYPQMELLKIPYREGFSSGLDGFDGCVRLWPHKCGGEGHFLALFQKRPKSSKEPFEAACEPPESPEFPLPFIDPQTAKKNRKKGKGSGQEDKAANQRNLRRDRTGVRGAAEKGKKRSDARSLQAEAQVAAEFFKEGGLSEDTLDTAFGRLEVRNGQVYAVSPLLPEVRGIPFLRNGLYLGEVKKERFEPSQALAMALRPGAFSSVIDLTLPDERIGRYLRGETVKIHPQEVRCETPWQLVCVNGYPLGWAKLADGFLKNKYHAGWRMQ